jgi:hypothetical protein
VRSAVNAHSAPIEFVIEPSLANTGQSAAAFGLETVKGQIFCLGAAMTANYPDGTRPVSRFELSVSSVPGVGRSCHHSGRDIPGAWSPAPGGEPLLSGGAEGGTGGRICEIPSSIHPNDRIQAQLVSAIRLAREQLGLTSEHAS